MTQYKVTLIGARQYIHSGRVWIKGKTETVSSKNMMPFMDRRELFRCEVIPAPDLPPAPPEEEGRESVLEEAPEEEGRASVPEEAPAPRKAGRPKKRR